MSEAKFTPGPWFFAYSDNATPHILTEDMQFTRHYDSHDVHDALICVMPAEITRSYNSDANARLIAAAPDLYEALMAYRGVKKCGHEFTCICADDMAAAALRKARGES